MKRVHLGETRLRAAGGELVELDAYRDTAHRDREVFRVTRDGQVVAEVKTPAELAKHVDVASLVEVEAASVS